MAKSNAKLSGKLNFARNAKSDLEFALEKKQKSYFFPANIEEIDHWMAIRINHRVFRKRDDYSIKEDIARIFLPMPLNVGTIYGQDYSTTGLSNIGNLAAGAGAFTRREIENGGAGIKSLADDVWNGGLSSGDLTSAAATFQRKTGIAQAAGGFAASAVLGVIEALPGVGVMAAGAMVGAGLARNPFMALVYNAPQLREHQFSWKLIAKDYTESVAILDIIKLLKYHSAPDYFLERNLNQHFFEYPEQFDIDFHHDDFLFNVAPSVLKSVEVNYHAEGIPLYHSVENDDGTSQKAPVAIQLTLSFQEVAIITKNEINEYNR